MPVTAVGPGTTGPPILLAGPLLDYPPNLADSGVALDEDVDIPKSLPLQEGKSLSGEIVAEILDVLHFAVEGLFVSHIRWFWFPDTKVAPINEMYVRQTDD